MRRASVVCLFTVFCGSGCSGTGPATGAGSGSSGGGASTGAIQSSTGATAESTNAATAGGSESSASGGSVGATSGGQSGSASSAAGSTTALFISGSTSVGIGTTTARHINGTAAAAGSGGTAGFTSSGSTSAGSSSAGLPCYPATPGPAKSVDPGVSTFAVGGTLNGLGSGTFAGPVALSDGIDCILLLPDGGPSQTFVFPTALPDLTCYDIGFADSVSAAACRLEAATGCLDNDSSTTLAVDCCPANCPGVCGSAFAQSFVDWPVRGFLANSTLQNFPQVDPLTGLLELTGQLSYQSTQLYLSTPFIADDFSLSFQFLATNGPNGPAADGFMVFLTPAVPALGKVAGGGGLAATGLGGAGFEFDFYDNGDCSDSSANHVGLDALTGCQYGSTPIALATSNDLTGELAVFGTDLQGAPSMADGAVHTVVITVAADAVTGFTIDGATVPELVSSPGNLVSLLRPQTGVRRGVPSYLGFAAASGKLTVSVEIGNVSMTLPAQTFCN